MKSWKETVTDDPLIKTLDGEIAQARARLKYLQSTKLGHWQKLYRRWRYATNYLGYRDKQAARVKNYVRQSRAKAAA